MVDSNVVLTGQTYAYTLYVLAIMSLMAWFAYKLTKTESTKEVKPVYFYSFVSLLIVVGVTLHIFTYHTIPWAPIDLNRKDIKADRVFNINMKDHKFILPEQKMLIKAGEMVLFNVTSDDLTYGFGLFREDNSMVMQMQVIPGHNNDILWHFEKPGVYTIRSTEYSGWKGYQMIEKNVVQVVEPGREVIN
ncbi:MAG: cytochrome C oxidase subunit II [Ignavibacteria bacterium]|nr:cytochrome C oxidase subunit II [Ignavibacteria bacterium]